MSRPSLKQTNDLLHLQEVDLLFRLAQAVKQATENGGRLHVFFLRQVRDESERELGCRQADRRSQVLNKVLKVPLVAGKAWHAELVPRATPKGIDPGACRARRLRCVRLCALAFAAALTVFLLQGALRLELRKFLQQEMVLQVACTF